MQFGHRFTYVVHCMKFNYAVLIRYSPDLQPWNHLNKFWWFNPAVRAGLPSGLNSWVSILPYCLSLISTFSDVFNKSICTHIYRDRMYYTLKLYAHGSGAADNKEWVYRSYMLWSIFIQIFLNDQDITVLISSSHFRDAATELLWHLTNMNIVEWNTSPGRKFNERTHSKPPLPDCKKAI